jgi:HSP20 family protein
MAERQSAATPARQEQGVARRSAGAGPFSALQRFANEVDRMFDDFGFGRRTNVPSVWGEARQSLWAPDVDVVQKNNELVITADLPGLSKDEVTVEVTDDAVTIQGERKREHEEEREGLYRSERSYGSFYRAIPLPEGAMSDQAKAAFRDGVLQITMPAPPASKGRRIEIEEATTAK